MLQISVIIPAFNCALYLPQALDSVLAQSLVDFEIIVVDDGSTDDTRDVVARYACSDSRVRYVYQENSGLPGARNTGVREARGEFIAALDADDLLAPNALAAMRKALRSSGASWCIIDVLKFWDNFRQVQRTQLPAGNLLHAILRDDFIRRAMFLETAALQRVGLWDADMKMREDWDLNIRLIEAREPYIYLPEPLYHYRKRPDSITTGNPDRLFHYTEQVLKKHARRHADAGDRVAARLYAENLWNLGRQHLYRRRDPRSALRCVRESFRYDFKPSRLLHAVRHNLLPARP